MTSFLIVDAQSVKNTDSAELKSYDAGKKVSGIKRHIAVDTQGLPHAITVTTADVTDRTGALEASTAVHQACSEFKVCWSTEATRDSRLPKGWKNAWEHPCRASFLTSQVDRVCCFSCRSYCSAVSG
jgi:hypothetical protein